MRHISDVASGPHSNLQMKLVGTVKESYLLQLPLKDSCIVHVVALDWPTASRGYPDESPTGDVGSETHSY